MKIVPTFITPFLVSGLVLGMTALAHSDDIRIGVSAPLSGPFALIGEQIRRGADAAAAMHTDEKVTLIVADDSCTQEGAAEAAQTFRDSDVRIVVGFACTDAIQAALEALSGEPVAIITPAVRTPNLNHPNDDEAVPVFRLAPSSNNEADAVADILTRRWRDKFFAIVDDGTIYGRELAESFRVRAEESGLKPAFIDGFRPQLDNQIGLAGRLRKSGASHVFVGGDRDDVAILGRDARQLGMNLEIAAGEAMRAEPGLVDLSPGTLMIGLPEWKALASEQTLEQLLALDSGVDGYTLPAFAATQIAAQTLTESRDTDRSVAELLSTSSYATILGSIKFAEDGDLVQNPYRLFRYDGMSFVPVDQP